MLADCPDGTLAEYALAPVETVTPLDGFEGADAARLAALSRFIVPYGGLVRGRLAAGETLVVNGATGAFGTAAVLLGVAMGAARVIAAGRNRDALAAVAEAAGARVAPVVLTGVVAADAKAIRQACGCGANLAFDMVGNASDPRSTLAALMSLRRNGRLVLMGSMTVDLPLPYSQVMLNNWEISASSCIRRAPTGVSSISSERPPRLERDQAARLRAVGSRRGDGGRRRGRRPRICRRADVTCRLCAQAN